MPDTHELKTWPAQFAAIVSGEKTFEIREDDRGFKVGDTLKLIEWDPDKGERVGRAAMHVYVTHLLQGGQFGLDGNFVAMSIKPRDTAA